jgi:hypothetical protein
MFAKSIDCLRKEKQFPPCAGSALIKYPPLSGLLSRAGASAGFQARKMACGSDGQGFWHPTFAPEKGAKMGTGRC